MLIKVIARSKCENIAMMSINVCTRNASSEVIIYTKYSTLHLRIFRRSVPVFFLHSMLSSVFLCTDFEINVFFLSAQYYFCIQYHLFFTSMIYHALLTYSIKFFFAFKVVFTSALCSISSFRTEIFFFLDLYALNYFPL